MKRVSDLVMTGIAVFVAATTLPVVVRAGTASVPSAVVAPAHICPPMC